MKTIMYDEEEDITRPISIPDELISEILTRLPVKSLTRFRTVSTRMNSTINHPSFSKSHFTRAAAAGDASVTLILTFINRFNSERTIFSVTIPPNQTRSLPNPTRVLTVSGFAHPFVSQSLNGLMCLNLGSMCVCNPSTRKFMKLPWTQREIRSSSSPGATHHRSTAFGFDPVSNAHKVIETWITIQDDEEEDLIMENRVFTVGSGLNEWRKIADGPSYFPFNENVCMNGQIYFRAFPSMKATEKPVMVAFDVNREVFRFIQMQDDPISNSEETVLIEHDGNLAIVDYQGLTNGERNVIVMQVLVNEERNDWMKKRVEIPAEFSEINDCRRFMFAGTTFSGEMIFTERSLVKPFYVVFYDMKKKEGKKVEICGLMDYEFNCCNVAMNVASVYQHVESIKCLN